jgi:hypothetical protein
VIEAGVRLMLELLMNLVGHRDEDYPGDVDRS